MEFFNNLLVASGLLSFAIIVLLITIYFFVRHNRT